MAGASGMKRNMGRGRYGANVMVSDPAASTPRPEMTESSLNTPYTAFSQPKWIG